MCAFLPPSQSLLHSIDLRKALLVYGSDASVGVTHTSDEEWEEGQQGDVFHGEEDQSLSGGGEVHGDGCGQEEDEGGVELLWQGFKLVYVIVRCICCIPNKIFERVGPRVNVDLNQNVEYIPEQPQWAGYRDPTPPSPPPSVDEYSPGQTQSVPSVPSGGTSSSRGSKRKAPMVDVIDSQFDKLTTSLDGFANVLNSSNVHFGVISDAAVRQVSAMEDRNEILRSQTEILRRTPIYTYTEADIYDMLSAMNIANETLLEQCYDFLCGNPTCTKRLIGLPPHKRWNKLCKMISGGDC
ncbi:uncharacterized protein HKW66_Vig0243830 [Vigna angularis]|uniref:Uncharacterized protein n=1 Tax=Phaseolus angularis TaxID=3914 RepID=A0A8T0KYD8_PHAAN|nr:uncharacterized protein HKW66_Vig0243830 [Vigna angularis]